MSTTEKQLNQNSVRFSQAPWYKPGLICIIGGLGGIGSYLSYYLGRQECELHLFDYDNIESTNLGGQFFTISDAENMRLKTDSCKVRIQRFSDNTEVYTYGKYTKDGLSTNYMFSCFDNLEARKDMFNNWCTFVHNNPNNDCIFIDGRLSAENFDVFFVTKDRIEKYKEDLYSDIKIEALPCNFKSTSHCGAMCAGIMVSGFNNYISNILFQDNVRDVPFKISTQLAFFNTNILWD